MGDTLVMKVAALVCAIALTILLNRIVDRPFEAWRRRILADGRPPS
jgi:peptidoglycan/LPS O-acetylase OafA/YrhL